MLADLNFEIEILGFLTFIWLLLAFSRKRKAFQLGLDMIKRSSYIKKERRKYTLVMLSNLNIPSRAHTFARTRRLAFNTTNEKKREDTH